MVFRADLTVFCLSFRASPGYSTECLTGGERDDVSSQGNHNFLEIPQDRRTACVDHDEGKQNPGVW